MKWIVPEFNYATGKYTGDYYDWSSFASIVFVDSDLGNDSTGLGTEASPWKTLTKAHNDVATVTGTIIVINGIFTESLNITKQVRIIGAGGGRNGRAIWQNTTFRIAYAVNITNIFLENIETVNYLTTFDFMFTSNAQGIIRRFLNCLLSSIRIRTLGGVSGTTFPSYFTIFKNVQFSMNQGTFVFTGLNNIMFDCTRIGGFSFQITGNNYHVNDNLSLTNTGSNNSLNINGLYFDSVNNDFNFATNSPLYNTGTVDTITGVPSNVGAGRLGVPFDGQSFEATIPSGAEFTNTEIGTTEIFRTDDTIDGFFESGVFDLQDIRRRVKLNLFSSFDTNGVKLTKLIQTTDNFTQRQALDCQIIYGNSLQEVQTKKTANQWLKCEYGKEISVTDVSGTLYGNADTLFDPDDYFFPSFRFLKFRLKFKNA